MGQFFDLNIPYLESDKNIQNKKSKHLIRLQTLIKSMELGYTGIAYNRTIKGIMSQSDGCTITPFPLSSLLKLHTSLSSAMSHRRKLLGVPVTAPFRQYTRLSVVAESDAQCSALNSGNPVLKTYHLVAVMPLNQKSFEHACQSAQVDMISIDFGKKLPFRLKLPMVKAAIARGVYFEITYSSLLEDAQVRRQMISTAKLLVEWTKGKNLIVSSGAPSALELRGPTDVSNLLHLLGLSSERAKAALSKNCRSLIADALRKKQFFKEVIRVEMMPVNEQTDFEKPWIADYFNWDPLSSGEGDLLLDDLAKSFSEAGNVSKAVKPIDFSSLIDIAPSHGNQAAATGFRIEGICHSSTDVVDFLSSPRVLELLKETDKPKKGLTSLSSRILDQRGNAAKTFGHSMFSNSLIDSSNACKKSPSGTLEELTELDSLKVAPVGLEGQSSSVANHVDDMICGSIRKSTSTNVALETNSMSKELILVQSEITNDNTVKDHSGQLGSGLSNTTTTKGSLELEVCHHSSALPSSDISLQDPPLQLKQLQVLDVVSTECDDMMVDVDSFLGSSAAGLVSGGIQYLEEPMKELEQGNVHADKIMLVDSFVERKDNDGLEEARGLPCLKGIAEEQEQSEEGHIKFGIDTPSHSGHITMPVDLSLQEKDASNSLNAKSMLMEEVVLETNNQAEGFVKAEHQYSDERKSDAGRRKVKQSTSGLALRLPFKRLLEAQFKKKGKTSLNKTKRR